MYKPWVQYVTNMLADMLVFVPKATVFAILIYFMTGMTLENNGIHFAGYLGMLITVFWLALANAEFFAYVSPNQQLAQAYFATIQTVFNLFCGFLIRKARKKAHLSHASTRPTCTRHTHTHTHISVAHTYARTVADARVLTRHSKHTSHISDHCRFPPMR
uniref:ABC-2 type transporter transmembrane domain-containing protein n=1 Tax=Lotharella globosa TaxID=91324 RepID=A0A7S4DQ34_9EUKA